MVSNFAGTGTNDASVGTIGWQNPENILADDNIYSRAIFSIGATSNFLVGKNFNFSIPNGSLINGIEVIIDKRIASSSGSYAVRDNIVKIVKTGNITGNNYAKTGGWPGSFTQYTYGSSTDLWGTTWTASDINSPDFGAAISAKATSTPIARVDFIKINVYYTPPPTISSFTPNIACSNSSQPVVITGTNFINVTSVNFNGTSASFTVNSANQITATLPSNATIGSISITTFSGTATSVDNFTLNSESVAPTNITGTTTICTGNSTTLTLNGGFPGTAAVAEWFSDTCGGTLLGSGNSITVTPATSTTYFVRYNGTCNSTSCASTTVTVNTPPSITIQPVNSQTTCSGNSASFSLNATGSGLTYQWYKGTTALIDGASVSGANSATLSINPVVTSDAGNNYYCLVSGSCLPNVTSNNINLTVHETPYIPNQTISTCSGNLFSLTPSNGIPTIATIIPANTTYSWPAPTVTGGITGGTTQIGKTSINDTLFNPTNIDQTATYTVTPTSGTTGNCIGNTFTLIVTVKPTPFINNISSTFCSDENFSITPTNGTGNLIPSGTTYSWIFPSADTGITGASTGTNQSNITQTLSNSANLNQTAAYTISPTSGTCIGNAFTLTVNINPKPIAIVGVTDSIICNNSSAGIVIAGNITDTVMNFDWIRDNTANVTGTSTGNSGSIAFGSIFTIPDTLNNTTAGTQNVTYTITPNSNGCTGAITTVTIAVTVIPSISPGIISGDQTICSNSNAAPFTETSTASGTNLSFQWRSNTVGIIGSWSDIPGATNTIYSAGIPTNDTTYFHRVAISTVSGVSCYSSSNYVTVTKNNITQPLISDNQNVCGSDDPSPLLTTSASSANGILTYQWQSNLVDCSGAWNDITGFTTTTYDPPIPTQTTYYQLVATSTLNGIQCPSASNCITVISNTKTWIGSADSNWNNPSNWAPNGIPTASNCVVISPGVNNPTISGSNYEAFANTLTVLPNGALTVNTTNSITVTNEVTVSNDGLFDIKDSAGLVQTNDYASNNGSIKMTRTTRPTTRWNYVYAGSPIIEDAFSQIPAQFDLKYKWQSGTQYGSWVPLTSLTSGEGFIARVKNIPPFSTGTGTIDFVYTGTPQNGLINLPVDSYDSNLTITGNSVLLSNPYPCAINAATFLQHTDNTELGGTLYFWTSVTTYSGTGTYATNDYASWNLTGGVGTAPANDPSNTNLTPNGYIAAGQGFFAQAISDGTISFDNSMRISDNNSQFFKNSSNAEKQKNRIWLNLYSDISFRQTLIGYIEGASDDFDRLFDGYAFTNNPTNIYSILNNSSLVIQGKSLPFNDKDIVPIGYKVSDTGTYSIAIDKTDGIFADSQNIFLRDKLFSTEHNLKESPYIFNSNSGTFDNRFELIYNSNSLEINNPDTIETFAVISNNTIKIQASEAIKSITVYDVSGKRITNYSLTEYTKQFSKPFDYANGIYLVKITLTNNLVVTKKIIHYPNNN